MSLYPGAFDALPTNHVDDVNEVIHAATINALADALNAVEGVLGITPQGSYASVVARLGGSDTAVAAINALLGSNPKGTYADVTARLGASDSTVAAINAMLGTNPKGTYADVAARLAANIPYGRTCITVAASDAPSDWKAHADYVCDGTDDHVQINQACLDAKGGGMVLLSPGHFNGGQLVTQERVWLRGVGLGTQYVLKNGVNADGLVNYVSPDNVVANAEFIVVSDFWLDCNKANQTAGRGIYFNVLPTGTKATNDLNFDPHNRVENVLISNTWGDGFAADSRSETRLRNVWVMQANGNGFVPSYDTFIDGCTADNVGLRGFYFKHSSVRCVNSKAFYSGQVTSTLGNGFNVEGTFGVVIAGCEAQDNKASAILLDTAYGCNVQMSADSNSTRGVGSSPAIDIWGGGNHIIEATCTERKADGTNAYQQHALRIRNASKGSRIDLQHYGQPGVTVGTAIDSGSTDIAGNVVNINAMGATVTPVYAATYTPDPYAAQYHRVGNLTAAITIGAPSNSHVGAELTLILRQDATGGRTITWNAAYVNTPTTVTTANGFTIGRFVYDGTSWVGV